MQTLKRTPYGCFIATAAVSLSSADSFKSASFRFVGPPEAFTVSGGSDLQPTLIN